MSKLEYDLENFGRLCHLHDKVAKLEQALAEKDREIQQIREHEFQRGYQEAQEKYQQILEKAVKFAEAFEVIAHDAEQQATIKQQAQEIARLREALENIVEGEGLWTKNDMAHEAQQALKETGK